MDDRPTTTAGLQAKVRLRQTWFEAHPNQPMPEGRAQVDALIKSVEDEAAGRHFPAHEAGDPHRYRIECQVCGEPGVVRLTIDPETTV